MLSPKPAQFSSLEKLVFQRKYNFRSPKSSCLTQVSGKFRQVPLSCFHVCCRSNSKESCFSNGRSLSWIHLIWTENLPPKVSVLALLNLCLYSKKKTCFCKSISALWSFLSLKLKLSQHLEVSVRLGQHKLLVLQSAFYYLSVSMLLHWDENNLSQKSLYLYPDTNGRQAVHPHSILLLQFMYTYSSLEQLPQI